MGQGVPSPWLSAAAPRLAPCPTLALPLPLPLLLFSSIAVGHVDLKFKDAVDPYNVQLIIFRITVSWR